MTALRVTLAGINGTHPVSLQKADILDVVRSLADTLTTLTSPHSVDGIAGVVLARIAALSVAE
jgi:hypothetical protein